MRRGDQGPGEGRVVDIAARADHGHRAALHRQLAGERGGQRHGAARLDHQLEFAKRRLHGVEHLVVGDDQARPQQLLGEREGDVARRRRQQRVADRAGELVVLLLGAGGQRAGEIVEARGLAGMDAGRGAEALDGERDAGRQAAARAGGRDGIERDAQPPWPARRSRGRPCPGRSGSRDDRRAARPWRRSSAAMPRPISSRLSLTRS